MLIIFFISPIDAFRYDRTRQLNVPIQARQWKLFGRLRVINVESSKPFSRKEYQKKHCMDLVIESIRGDQKGNVLLLMKVLKRYELGDKIRWARFVPWRFPLNVFDYIWVSEVVGQIVGEWRDLVFVLSFFFSSCLFFFLFISSARFKTRGRSILIYYLLSIHSSFNA